jgi:hypothetical protein
MAIYGRWQATIVNEAGDIQPGALVEVRSETAGFPLAIIYSDRAGTTPINNPATADSNGYVFFHVAGGAYKIVASYTDGSRTWRYVPIGTAGETDVADLPDLLPFSQDDPNAVERTILEKDREIVSVTDFDTFQHAVDYCVDNGSELWMPPGAHTPASGVTISDSIIMRGSGWLTTAIQAPQGSNFKLLHFTGGRPDIRDVAIFGAGGQGFVSNTLDITTISGSAHTIHLDGCVDANIERCYITGGWSCILNDAADTIIDRCFIAYALGSASVYNRGIALWMRRCKCDQSWPVSTPAYGYTAPSARANSTHYDAGQTSTLSGFILQCKTAGTTAGSAPALKSYFQDIADGSVVWNLVGPTTSYSLLLDTGASETHIDQSDFSGCWNTAAIGLRNLGAGTAPYLTFISQCVISQSPGGSIDATDGKALYVDSSEIYGGLNTGSSALAVRSNWAGELNAVGNLIASGAIGIYNAAGVRNRAFGNSVGGFATAAFYTKAGVSDWDFSFNEAGSNLTAGANAAALIVEAGGSDHWKFIGNDTRGTTGSAIQDSSTGTDKTIHSNGIATTTAWPHDMLPTGDNLYTLGSASKRWSQIYAMAGTIYGDLTTNRAFISTNAGLFLHDSDASNWLNIKTPSNLTADRILNFTTGDADRTVTLNGNPTLADWFDQAVKTTSNPQFATIELGAASDTTLSRASAGVAAVEGVNLLASNAAGIQTFLTSPSSANLRTALTDSTGTGVNVFDTAPAFTTSITTPKVIGGTGTGSTLTLQSTSGVGATDGIAFNVGNNGATQAVYINKNGRISLGYQNTSDGGAVRLDIVESGGGGQMRFRYDTSGSGLLINQNSSGGNTSINLQANARLSFATNNSDRLYIQAAGGVSIGTATSINAGDLLATGMFGIGSTNAPAHFVDIAAGTATVAPLRMASGTNLTTPVAGTHEYDGVQHYKTIDTSSGRGAVPVEQYFHLTADGSTISTIANFFGTTSNISLVASAYYEIEIEVFFLNTTAGTVTWTLTNSAAPTSQNIDFEMSPLTGIVAPGSASATMLRGQIEKDATAALAFTTGTLTTAVEHFARFKIKLQNGTGTSLKIQATKNVGGTITPRLGSRWLCRRMSPNNIGTFAA